jgi:hypothetical protein
LESYRVYHEIIKTNSKETDQSKQEASRQLLLVNNEIACRKRNNKTIIEQYYLDFNDFKTLNRGPFASSQLAKDWIKNRYPNIKDYGKIIAQDNRSFATICIYKNEKLLAP